MTSTATKAPTTAAMTSEPMRAPRLVTTMPAGSGGTEAWLPLARSGRAETSEGAGEEREMRGGREVSLPRGPDDSLRPARGVFCELPSSRGGAAGLRAAGVAAGAELSSGAAGLRVGLAFSSATAAGFSRGAGSAPPALVRLGSAAALLPPRMGTVGSAGTTALGLASSPPAAREPPDPVELAGTGAASLPSVPSAGLASAPSPVTWKRTRPGMVMRLFTDSAEAMASLRELPVEAFDDDPDEAAKGPLFPDEDEDEAALNSPDSAATRRPLRVEA